MKGTKEKQLTMNLRYRYPPEEMGNPLLPHLIELSECFIREKIHECSLFDKEELTSICCPFCEDGILRLKKVVPVYRNNSSPWPDTKHQIGNHYKYDCSNSFCNGEFFGTLIWI